MYFRYTKLCPVWCSERASEARSIATTNVNLLQNVSNMKDELVSKLLTVSHNINSTVCELLWIEPENEEEEKEPEKVRGLLRGAYNALNEMTERMIKEERKKRA